MLDVICATRLASTEFWARSALGLSLRRLAHESRLKPRIHFDNARGLPAIYNERIDAPDASELLVFIHDDVWLDDHFFFEHVASALNAVDIAGVAGNRRRMPDQPSWAFVSPRFDWDSRANLSGTVCHGAEAFGTPTYFGPVPATCELLDGVLLAARRDALKQRGVRFDERFDFHFYDLDFCRSARQAGFTLATWPIAITHQSRGRAGTPGWEENYIRYLEKWGE
ncbi:MAG: hypothetical protein EKK53_18680 [Burkholderiales bacterium]|nr:MAG: hypothetical protein EKK53_18680 [Burkholderiales bacterium]